MLPRKKSFFLILISFLFFQTLKGQNSEERIIKYIAKSSSDDNLPQFEKLNRRLGIEKQVQNTLNEVIGQGFFAASVDSINNERKDSIFVYFFLGEKYKWLKINKSDIDEGVINKIGFREKLYNDKPFRFSDVDVLLKRLIQYYENNGFPFVTAGLKDVEIDTLNQVSANLWLEKNIEYNLDSLILKGDNKVSHKYLSNYLGLKEGSYYNESNIKKIKKRVEDLPFLDLTESPSVEFNKEEAKVYLFLKDRKASQFDGIVGILPDDNNEGEFLITGDLKLKLLSSFGRGELIDLNWRKLQTETQDLKVNFAYPYLFGSSFGVDVKFNLYKRDSTFINLNQVLAVQYLLSGGDYFEIFINNKSSNVLTGNAFLGGIPGETNLNTQNLAGTQSLLYGIGVFKQQLDYRFNPRKGYFVDADASVGTRRVTLRDEIETSNDIDEEGNNVQYELNFKGGVFLPLLGRATIMFQNITGLTSAETIYQNELSRIGGLKTLRGFDEEAFFSSMYSIFTIEARYLLERNSYAHVFFDGAYYENMSLGNNIVDRPYGFGAGFSFETRAGIFSISYALGKQFDNPIEFRTGKIHFGVVGFF